MDRFTALADPNRRRILELLGNMPMASGALADRIALSPPAMSQHLKTLREAGLVRVAIEGQRRIYSLDPEGLGEIDAWIGRVRGQWKSRLDALEAALAQEEGDPK